MAIHTTFFVCAPGDLPGGFPGWRLPLEESVRREVRNRFTGAVSIIETREPDWSDAAETPAPAPEVAEIHGRYEDYLEARLPALVRARPHCAAKDLTEVELRPLCDAVGVEPDMSRPLYGPPSAGGHLVRLPPALLAAVRTADPDALAGRWAALSTFEHADPAAGDRLSNGWTVTEAADTLRALAAGAGQEAYLLTDFSDP